MKLQLFAALVAASLTMVGCASTAKPDAEKTATVQSVSATSVSATSVSGIRGELKVVSPNAMRNRNQAQIRCPTCR